MPFNSFDNLKYKATVKKLHEEGMTTSTGCNHSNLHVPFTPKHQYAYSLYCSLYISWGNDRENFFNKQEALQLVIISFIVTLLFDSGAIFFGKTRCW